MTSQPTDWKTRLEDLNAPPLVVDWARRQFEFGRAWAVCDDPMVRVWVARAGGVSQAEIVGAVAILFRDAVGVAPVSDVAAAAVNAASIALFRCLQARCEDAERERAEDDIANAKRALDGTERDLAYAAELALRAATPLDKRDMPHDFMWMFDASSALGVLVQGFKGPGVLDKAGTDARLRELWSPTRQLAERAPVSLADIAALTDAQIVGRAQLLALESGPAAPEFASTIAVTVTVEHEVCNGGFGQFFHNWSVHAGLQAVAAYGRLGRDDLRGIVARAAEVAEGLGSAELLHHPDFSELDATMWRALHDDPTSQRANYVRSQLT